MILSTEGFYETHLDYIWTPFSDTKRLTSYVLKLSYDNIQANKHG